MQQVVRLLGDLGERYGAEHVYQNLRTPADAIKLLCINYPEFRNELLVAHKKGIGYRVLQAGVDLSLNDLQLPIGQNDLILTPCWSGRCWSDDNWPDRAGNLWCCLDWRCVFYWWCNDWPAGFSFERH